MAEWLKALSWKGSGLKGPIGSNPIISAMEYEKKWTQEGYENAGSGKAGPRFYRAFKRGAKWMMKRLIRKDLKAEEKKD